MDFPKHYSQRLFVNLCPKSNSQHIIYVATFKLQNTINIITKKQLTAITCIRSCVCVCVCVCVHARACAQLCPGKNTGVGCHFPLQGIKLYHSYLISWGNFTYIVLMIHLSIHLLICPMFIYTHTVLDKHTLLYLRIF